ncbi:hypothetical protein ACOYW6_08455 [Parablastomonas sp. CN1-191]|uniref:hypothetical protein n=1 Tax=Parablastomonas sp. CN1-191 TaxID=3400908 RepID=UPI003BF8081F
MDRQGDEVHVDDTEASGGSTPHIVRYVLVISLFLAIAALTLIWVTGALTSDQGSRTGTVTNQATPAGDASAPAG